MRAEIHRETARLLTQLRRHCTVAVNKQLAVVGSSMHEFVVLLRVSEEDDVPQSDLAYDAAIDPAAVSRLIRDMTRAGTVTTRVDPTDKRQRFVKATAKGRTLARTLAPIVDSTLAPYMGGLTADEGEEFLRLLRKAYATVVAVAESDSKSEQASLRLASAKPSTPRASTRTPGRARKSQSAE
jgi:DNA-binding MarR family transcriptional regulator